MKTCFALPSADYTIVLSKEELQKLIENKHVNVRINYIPHIFIDDHNKRSKDGYCKLFYHFQTEEYPVQFLNICLEGV